MNLPYPVTAISFARIDLGDQLADRCYRPRLVGAATFTSHVTQGKASFALDVAVCSASDPVDGLLVWLDDQLAADAGTLSAFDLVSDLRLMRAMPRARWSPALRKLTGRFQPVIDLGASDNDEPIGFAQCCAALDIPCAAPASVQDFVGWCTGRPHSIARALELDVIAVWRLTMQQIAARSTLGGRVSRALEVELATWLRGVEIPAAAAHLATLGDERR